MDKWKLTPEALEAAAVSAENWPEHTTCQCYMLHSIGEYLVGDHLECSSREARKYGGPGVCAAVAVTGDRAWDQMGGMDRMKVCQKFISLLEKAIDHYPMKIDEGQGGHVASHFRSFKRGMENN